jgi:hypothetical protein
LAVGVVVYYGKIRDSLGETHPRVNRDDICGNVAE